MKQKAKVGLFGVGHPTYWGQFDGLLDRLKGYQAGIKEKMENFGVEVIDVGLIDDPAVARTAADTLASNQVDIICLSGSVHFMFIGVCPL